MAETNESKFDSKKLFLKIGTIGTALGIVTGFISNFEKLSDHIIKISAFVSNRATASVLANNTLRDILGKWLLQRKFLDGNACFLRSYPIGLNGDGVKSDLVVTFQRTIKLHDCSRIDSPEDAAFFQSTWNGFHYVGDPELPQAQTVWNVAGPAAFREAADSSYPTIDTYMLKGKEIIKICCVESVTMGEYTSTNYIESKDGKSAWVVNAASISKVDFGSDGNPRITRLDGKILVAENVGMHLISYGVEGSLAFDGDPALVEPKRSSDSDVALPTTPDVSNPRDGDEFTVKIAPGYHVYLIGCAPKNGLTVVPTEPGAFAVDLSQNPFVTCALGEEMSFKISIIPKSY
jgi:hypothetical protein